MRSDPLLVSLRRDRAVTALLPLFFLSGATSLVYQTVWARQLYLVFGTSSFAITTVLAAFMAGLGLGGWLAARIADPLRHPLRAYALIEVGIGLYALVFPWILEAITPAYLAASDQGPIGLGLVQLLLVGTALLAPTTAMGATLPLLARFAVDQVRSAGDGIGRLYGVNTAGAVAGTWFAGFVLLPWLGLSKTTLVAACANVALGVAALALDRWTGPLEAAEESGVDRSAPIAPVLVAMALAGFASLVLEVAWTRVLGLLLGPSVYAFSIMLLAFLIGIALGGRLGGPLADWVHRRAQTRGVLWTLALVELGVGASSLALMALYPELPYWYVWMFDALGGSSRPGSMWVVSSLTAGIATTGPAVLMGAAFPIAVRAVVHDPGVLGGPVGRVYAANTFGGVAGAVAAGFVLLPIFAVRGAVTAAVWANVAAACILIVASRRGAALGIPAVAIALLATRPVWDPVIMTSGLHHYVTHFEDHSRAGIDRFGVSSYELLYYQEGLATVLTVGRNHATGSIWLAHNGKVEASSSGDLPTQLLIGLLPFAFDRTPKSALVIGLASGITAGAASLGPDLETLDIVEIEANTATAARYFDPYNESVLDDPRTRLIIADGRNHLLRRPAAYDVIVNQPSNPWISGVANLFTAEFFALGRSRLSPAGIWVQWIQTYGMATDDLQSLLATFSDAYPHVQLFATARRADLILLGSDQPLTLDLDEMAALLAEPGPGRALGQVEIEVPTDLLAYHQLDRSTLIELVGPVTRNTDDNMRIEYSAPRSVHTNTSLRNVRLIEDHGVLPLDTTGPDPLRLLDLAETYRRLEDPRADDAEALAQQILGQGDAP